MGLGHSTFMSPDVALAYNHHNHTVMDLWFPQSRDCDLLLAFHGGGWQVGSGRWTSWMGSSLLLRYIVRTHCVASVEYRGHPTSPFPAPLQDAHDAFHFAKHMIRARFIKKIYTLGVSAGGTMALWLATHPHTGSHIKGAICIACPTTIEEEEIRSFFAQQAAVCIFSHPMLRYANRGNHTGFLSPYSMLSTQSAPMLLLYQSNTNTQVADCANHFIHHATFGRALLQKSTHLGHKASFVETHNISATECPHCAHIVRFLANMQSDTNISHNMTSVM